MLRKLKNIHFPVANDNINTHICNPIPAFQHQRNLRPKKNTHTHFAALKNEKKKLKLHSTSHLSTCKEKKFNFLAVYAFFSTIPMINENFFSRVEYMTG